MLWSSALTFSIAVINPLWTHVAINIANYSLSAFMSMWFFFLCGGFWFGYWIKTPQIQEVHMKLIIISIVEIIFINI